MKECEIKIPTSHSKNKKKKMCASVRWEKTQQKCQLRERRIKNSIHNFTTMMMMIIISAHLWSCSNEQILDIPCRSILIRPHESRSLETFLLDRLKRILLHSIKIDRFPFELTKILLFFVPRHTLMESHYQKLFSAHQLTIIVKAQCWCVSVYAWIALKSSNKHCWLRLDAVAINDVHLNIFPSSTSSFLFHFSIECVLLAYLFMLLAALIHTWTILR